MRVTRVGDTHAPPPHTRSRAPHAHQQKESHPFFQPRPLRARVRTRRSRPLSLLFLNKMAPSVSAAADAGDKKHGVAAKKAARKKAAKAAKR